MEEICYCNFPNPIASHSKTAKRHEIYNPIGRAYDNFRIKTETGGNFHQGKRQDFTALMDGLVNWRARFVTRAQPMRQA
jgi:hypothetical protein